MAQSVLECNECGYTCRAREAVVPISQRTLEQQGVNRLQYFGLLPIADYANSIEQCPVREIIEEKREAMGDGLMGRLRWFLDNEEIRREAALHMDEPTKVDMVSAALILGIPNLY